MNQKDQKRIDELLNEVIKIFDSKNPMSYREIIKDINKELEEIIKRNEIKRVVL